MDHTPSDRPSLARLLDAQRAILQAVADNGGELTEDLDKQLEAIGDDLKAKVDAYNFVQDRFNSEADYWRAKAKEMTRMAHTCEAIAERVRDLILRGIMVDGKTEAVGNEVRAVVVKGRSKLVIDDEDDLPHNFYMPVQKIELDKTRLREALERGEQIEGARLLETHQLRWYRASSQKALKEDKS